MKKCVIMCVLSIFLLTSVGIAAQEVDENRLLFAYQRNFARGSLSTKVKVLQDAAESGENGMGKLYLQALEFYLDNYNTLSEDATALELVKMAARLTGEDQYEPAIDALWMIFQQDEDTGVQVAAMNSLGDLLTSEHPLMQKLYSYLKVQNEQYLLGKDVDIQVVAETIATLGKIGSAASFPALFAAIHLGYPEQIEQKARDAINRLEGDTAEMVAEVLETGFAREKKPVLEWAMEKDSFSREQKGELAQKALEVGLELTNNEEINALIRELRYASVRYLTELEWSQATSLLINHFDQTNVEVDRGITPRSVLLEAIAALGTMGTNEAAVRLSLYLEVLNTYMENGQRVDEQVVLAVVRNLGKLGSNVAFDHLLYAMYLDYPRSVKQAAREVLSDLQQ
ncbi:MAG: hypothetical protein ACP5IA_00010 [Sediminispirochaetaceae bacterium]